MTSELKQPGWAAAADCPLDEVRVLDLSRVVAGNMLTVMLADFGADVIKIETPGSGDPLREWLADGLSLYWKTLARNKRSVTLNLRDAEGRALLDQLVATADVLVENYRPGVLERMGFAPERLLALKPRLIVVRISGFGQTGPYRDRPGFGTLIEAMSGFAAKTGFADRPPVLPNLALADVVAGMNGAFAVMVALRAAAAPDGAGQVIDLSLLEPLVSTLSVDAAIHEWTGQLPERLGSRSNIAAPRNVYRTSDGEYVAISASTQAMAARLFAAIGRPELIDDSRFSDNAARVANGAALDEVIASFFTARTQADNLAAMQQAEVTCGPVYDAAQLKRDPHIVDRGVLVALPDADAGTFATHDVVPRLSVTPGALRRPAPTLGEHTAEVLAALGVDADAQAALAARGAI